MKEASENKESSASSTGEELNFSFEKKKEASPGETQSDESPTKEEIIDAEILRHEKTFMSDDKPKEDDEPTVVAVDNCRKVNIHNINHFK